MDTRLARPLLTLLAALLVAVAVAAAAPAQGSAAHQLDIASFDRVWTLVRDAHPDPTLGGLDWEAVRIELRPRVEQATSREAARDVMQVMLDRLGHSHLAILPAEELADLAAPTQTSHVQGETGLDARVVDGRALVTGVRPGSPAARAGVCPGWEIQSIGGEALEPVIRRLTERLAGRSFLSGTLAQAVLGRLAGQVGARVEVAFRDGEDRTVTRELEMAEARGNRCAIGHVSGVRVWLEARWLADGVGLVAFNAFLDPARVMPALEEALRGFRDARGVVLDLRGNSGGMPGMVTGVAGWFVEGEPRSIGTVRLRDARLELVVQPRPRPYPGRLAIVVDGTSMCGSEVLAAGLRDLGRARLFGSRTAGVVMSGQLEKLPSGDVLMVAFATFTTVRGETLEGRGLVPDEVVPCTREALLAGADPALDAAVRWLRAGTPTSR